MGRKARSKEAKPQFAWLSNQQKWLLNIDKRGYKGGLDEINVSREYSEIESKARKAVTILTNLAGLNYEQLPRDRYERILPSKELIEMVDVLISGQNRSKNNKGIQPDIYGAQLATEIAEICLRKLEHEFGLAIENQMTAEDNKRHVHGEGTRLLYVRDFEEKTKNLLLWFGAILDEVRRQRID